LTVTTTNGSTVVRRTRLEDKDGNPVRTIAEAVKELNRLRVKREEDTLVLTPKRTPTFAEAAKTYLKFHQSVREKAKTTIRAEGSCIKRLSRTFGARRLREITPALLNAYKTERAGENVSPRTINLELVVLRNVMRRAVEDGILQKRHIPSVAWLQYKAPSRKLLTQSDISQLCDAAVEKLPNSGQALADLIRLMAYSGARVSEALALRWSAVSFERSQVTIHGKGDKTRHVDFNEPLEAHLRGMRARHRIESAFLFPSPRTGDADAPMGSMNMALRMAREAAGIPWFTFHLCRHFFASYCVMSGVDIMTVAAWLGHADGGLLIGKVYGHLADEHRKAMAQRLTFTPTVVEKAEAG
jgi:integrase